MSKNERASALTQTNTSFTTSLSFYNTRPVAGSSSALCDSVGDGKIDAIIPAPHSNNREILDVALHSDAAAGEGVAASVSEDELVIYDRRSGVWSVRFKVARPSQLPPPAAQAAAAMVATCAFSDDGTLLATTWGGVVYVWDQNQCVLVDSYLQVRASTFARTKRALKRSNY